MLLIAVTHRVQISPSVTGPWHFEPRKTECHHTPQLFTWLAGPTLTQYTVSSWPSSLWAQWGLWDFWGW